MIAAPIVVHAVAVAAPPQGIDVFRVLAAHPATREAVKNGAELDDRAPLSAVGNAGLQMNSPPPPSPDVRDPSTCIERIARGEATSLS